MKSAILADTSIWIEFFRGVEPIFSLFSAELEEGNVLAVEWVFGELLQGVKGAKEQKIIELYWDNLKKIHYENIWIEAGIYSAARRLVAKGIGLIDVVILLSAKKSGAKLWTLDKKLLKVVKKEHLFQPMRAFSSAG